MDQATVTEARELAEATGQLLDDATEAALRLHVLGAVTDARTDDAESHLAARGEPDRQVAYDHLGEAARNPTVLLARLDGIVPDPSPTVREDAWEGVVSDE